MNWDDMLLALGERNGNGSNGVEELEEMFPDSGYVFRHFPDARCGVLRWQCGRNVSDIMELEDGSGYIAEYFELLEWASTREGLIDKLSER
jgi:hypothetical protein